jgi:enediyne biosynthesis protein E4
MRRCLKQNAFLVPGFNRPLQWESEYVSNPARMGLRYTMPPTMARRTDLLRLLILSFLFLAASAPAPIFREVPARESGIAWTHQNGRSEHRYLPETTGAGVALLDYNNDGWMDILLVNSGPSSFYKPDVALLSALYRNNHDGTFTDVAKEAGITTEIYGMGVAAGDYDGDGFQDIFISGVGKCVLYHNNRNGTFTDVTEESGIRDSQWGTSAVWFDYDGDGKLDLFVGEFADYSSNRICGVSDSYGGAKQGALEGQSFYCVPSVLKPMPSHLYRNLGGGKFADVSQSTGILSRPGRAWGVVAADINGDRYPDLFVSNDLLPNFLWVNQKGKRFEESGLIAGVGYSSEGVARSGMGVDAGDFDRDGREDLIVANIDAQTTSLYRNSSREAFDDINVRTGVGPLTRMLSGWGLRFFDYDNDGWLDLILSNGHPDDQVDDRNAGIRYRQPILLLHNVGGIKTVNVSDSAGPAFSGRYSARGLAVGDLNNDGYPDVVITENGGPVHLLMNAAQAGNNWLGLTLAAKTANPAGAGAILRWSTAGRIFSRQKTAGGSFLSSQDPREIIGSGKAPIDWVEVQWPLPSHRVDRILHPEMNHYLVIAEGQTGVVKTPK